jgi:hypothetical protein
MLLVCVCVLAIEKQWANRAFWNGKARWCDNRVNIIEYYTGTVFKCHLLLLLFHLLRE